MRVSLFVALFACSCGPSRPAHESSPRLGRSSDCPERSYDAWKREVAQLVERFSRTADGPACRRGVETSLEGLTSATAKPTADAEAIATIPEESCAALEARYVSSCVGPVGFGNGNCVDMNIEYYRRGCAGEPASAAWKAAIDERARASLRGLESVEVVRRDVVVAADCIDAAATADPGWRELTRRARELATEKPSLTSRGVGQSGCRLEDIACGVNAWLRMLKCQPPLPQRPAGSCTCSKSDLMCNMQCSNH